MAESVFCKLMQRRAYDLLSQKYGFISVLLATILLASSVFFFGEAALEWSSEKYAAVFNSFSDNLLRKSFQKRLCSPVPIDVVYTWVNGSDPRLLAELRLLKATLEKEELLNVSTAAATAAAGTKCTYAHCVPANRAVILQVLPNVTDLEHLKLVCSSCAAVNKMEAVTTDDSLNNITVLHYDYGTNLSISGDLTIGNKVFQVKQGFYTSDLTVPNSVLLHSVLLMSGLKNWYGSKELRKQLPEAAQRLVLDLQSFETESVAVIFTRTPADATSLLNMASNITVADRQPIMNLANFVYTLSYVQKPEDISASRYEDNEELRYSLRSLQKHAPWVRHVYLVTNGQIPYWLNMENPRLTVVTHEEIFLNKSHLPTFSSPAIESHLHRIPGLSDKFIYMNDDVMFGQSIWPDDFYTHSKGQKVHLTWSIPDCSPGCPQSWIKDGYCDKACNSSACQFDGGDCDGGRPAFGQGAAGGGVPNANWHDSWVQNSQALCHTGCSNHWIADKYCDQTCNVRDCGYDAGDCGASNFHSLPMYSLTANQTRYSLRPGERVVYFNVSSVFRRIDEARFDEEKVVRVAAVSNKYKVITLLLHSNYSSTPLAFNLTGKDANNERPFSLRYMVVVDTKSVESLDGGLPAGADTNGHNGSVEEPNHYFKDIPEHERSPIPAGAPSTPANLLALLSGVNLSDLELPAEMISRLALLDAQLSDGLLSVKGYELKKSILLHEVLHSLPASSVIVTAPTARATAGLVSGGIIERIAAAAAFNTDSHNDNGHAGRKLLAVNDLGFFPWERVGTFDRLVQELEERQSRLARESVYSSAWLASRRLLALDTFAESLHHVNRLYNSAFGFATRKVLGHIAHMIDRNAMDELQGRFPSEWDATSSHRVRSSSDMQFAFAYFHYIMSAKRNDTVEEFINLMDTDDSGILSDRELRTMATRILDSPLDLQSLVTMEHNIMNCSKVQQEMFIGENASTPKPLLYAKTESYYDSAMPQVTKQLLLACEPVLELVRKKIKPAFKYKFETVGEEDITFKMIGTNLSIIIGQLDDIRRNTRKFICLNDNIDHHNADAPNVKALLQDFYESLFPIPSQFELPRDYRNRYLHVVELREWKQYRGVLKTGTVAFLLLLVVYATLSFCCTWLRRWCPRRRRPEVGLVQPAALGAGSSGGPRVLASV